MKASVVESELVLKKFSDAFIQELNYFTKKRIEWMKQEMLALVESKLEFFEKSANVWDQLIPSNE